MTLILFLSWLTQAFIGYWICRNSCANAYWKEGKTHHGVRNFDTICEWGLFWNFIPIVGFIGTYCFITDNGEVLWEEITIRYVKEAWL